MRSSQITLRTCFFYSTPGIEANGTFHGGTALVIGRTVTQKCSSTSDQLLPLETFVCEAFIQKQHAVAVFLYLEKAYDTTWKNGIMQDLFNAGLRGHLPVFI